MVASCNEVATARPSVSSMSTKSAPISNARECGDLSCMKNRRMRPGMSHGLRIVTQNVSREYQPKKTPVRSCQPLKLRLHLKGGMHDAEEQTQQILLLQKAEIKNHGSVRDDCHLLPSTRRVSRSWASISSV
jgi:hypothetical protein